MKGKATERDALSPRPSGQKMKAGSLMVKHNSTDDRAIDNECTQYDHKAFGVKTERLPWGQIFTGTKEALVAAQIVPDTFAFPGEIVRRRGKLISFVNGAGVECRVNKNGKKKFQVWISFTPTEIQKQERLLEVQKQISVISTSQETKRANAVETLNLAFLMLIREMFRVSPTGEQLAINSVWYYDKSFHKSLESTYWDIRKIIDNSPLSRNDVFLQQLEGAAAAVSDDKFQRFLSGMVR